MNRDPCDTKHGEATEKNEEEVVLNQLAKELNSKLVLQSYK